MALIRLVFKCKPKWPKLAWVAVHSPGTETFIVHHGPMVEVRDTWAIEGVWDGDFDKGDFDKTDLVFGSGIRQRGKEVIFISSATGLDRLWYVKQKASTIISNTLPGLLRIAGLSLDSSYQAYSDDMESIGTKGLNHYIKKIPADAQDINVVYYKNLSWMDGEIREIDKCDCTPTIYCFHSYEQYLKQSAINIGKNTLSSGRNFKVDMLVGISTGYDSVATAVISRYAGCNKSATISNATSFWRGSDSGEKIAALLGFSCQAYKHVYKNYKNEVSIWAAAGRAGGRTLTIFDYPKPLCLFFSGVYGDKVWDRNSVAAGPAGGMNEALCEYRLIEGVFVTNVPWWGIRKAKEINLINNLNEMKPWTLETNYDRPIARRIIEEAGIPRGLFAVRKKDTSSNSPLRWPATYKARKSFREYLFTAKIKVPSENTIKLFEILSFVSNLIYKNTAKRFGRKKWWRPWLKFPGRQQIFVWANHELRDKYYGND